MIDPRREPGLDWRHEERLELLRRGAGMTADLVDVGHVALGSTDAVDDQVSGARHGHQRLEASGHDLPVLSRREGSAGRMERMALAAPEADRAGGGAREDRPAPPAF